MKPIALSFSRMDAYRMCPRQYQLKYITKTYPSEDDKPVFVRGRAVHKELENYIIAKTTKMSPIDADSDQVRRVYQLIDTILKAYERVYAEQKLAIGRNYKPCDWMAGNVKWRGIIDILAVRGDEMFAGDFKTGKIREYDEEGGQLHLTAMMLFLVFPKIQQITVSYIFVDHVRFSDPITLPRGDLPELVKRFDGRYDVVNSDSEFEPKRNQYCKWCLATKTQCYLK